jgi:DNA repair protein RecN (Recombination protein N)
VLDRLKLRYGVDEEAVLRSRADAAQDLEGLRRLDAEGARLDEALRNAETDYVRAATALGKARRSASGRLEAAILEQLGALALPKARLEVAFSPARGRPLEAEGGSGAPFHARGGERVEFLLAANPGEPPRPLAKVASGGELSRIMLALHAVLEGAGQGRALVFDEVDAGIGGSVADAVGGRLARLARKSQVLCVTHLPQVAAYADRHYHVRKRVLRGRTHAEVLLLAGEGRVDEMARMLGGREVTDASRRNAVDLLHAASGGARVSSRGKDR